MELYPWEIQARQSADECLSELRRALSRLGNIPWRSLTQKEMWESRAGDMALSEAQAVGTRCRKLEADLEAAVSAAERHRDAVREDIHNRALARLAS